MVQLFQIEGFGFMILSVVIYLNKSTTSCRDQIITNDKTKNETEIYYSAI